MLSQDLICQLVSISSELEAINLPHETVAYEQKLKIIENISTLLNKYSQTDPKHSQRIIKDIFKLLIDLQEVTDNRLDILEFVRNISPKV